MSVGRDAFTHGDLRSLVALTGSAASAPLFSLQQRQDIEYISGHRIPRRGKRAL